MGDEPTLGQLQRAFPPLVAKLIAFAYAQGYELTFGECWRSTATARLNAEQHVGIVNSLHIDRLAIDLCLFRDGVYLTDPTAYKVLGDFWKQQHTLAAWGGDFRTVDAGHFSLAYGGRK